MIGWVIKVPIVNLSVIDINDITKLYDDCELNYYE